MGIKDLWNVLTPFGERKPLYELHGKTVAVDLSGWVCQAQCIADYQVQPKMYLRNLYFRTCCLLMLDVGIVFVLEGEAPAMKHGTIQARNAVQFKGAKPRKNPTTSTNAKGRTRFHHVLKSCEDMLRLMGLECVTAVGEAEAMCAYLNEENMVDGCISQDSDCFAYGARVVYKNFSISQQGAHAGAGGSVDVYDLTKASDAIGFGRNKVIALALLCGSDYNDGVHGVGKDSAMKLFSGVPDELILDRIRSWRKRNTLYAGLQKDALDKVCSKCGHTGMRAVHTRSGCAECLMKKGCRENEFDDVERLQVKSEVAIRSKALEDAGFPDEVLIGEFLNRRDKLDGLNLKWRKPNVVSFMAFTDKHLQWEYSYSFEKIFPILTRWILLNSNNCDKNDPIPKYIKKIRNPKGVPSYEIIWDYPTMETKLQAADPETELDPLKVFATIEPQHLVQTAFPKLIETYTQSKIKVPKRKPKKLKKQATLENFVVSNEPDTSMFGDDAADVDLSLIIEDIVSRGIPEEIQNKLREIETESRSDLNQSHFFGEVQDDVEDVFERTFNELLGKEAVSESSSEDEFATENYVPLIERLKKHL